MIKTVFQHAELRDENDNIIQQGAYGKNTVLCNKTNDAWIDFVANNLEWLYDEIEDIDTEGLQEDIGELRNDVDALSEDFTVENLTVTGAGIAPTVAANDNSNNIATTAYADRSSANAAAAIVDSAPGTLDTLAELAAALGDDPNFATTIATLIDTKCARAKLDAHPVGSFYESTDPTSPAELFGGTWEEKIPDGELVGAVVAFAGNTLPDGWLLCDGSTVDRTLYAALFTAIGTTYGAGNGSSTFNLPNLIDRFIQGNATSGTVKSAGLPNITGRIDPTFQNIGVFFNEKETNGAFKAVNDTTNATAQITIVSGKTKRVASFDASRSSSIYGNSTTVQPPALTMRFAIYSGVVSKKLWLRTF